MSDFNPDVYLKNNAVKAPVPNASQGSSFDPGTYIQKNKPSAVLRSIWEAIGQGVTQKEIQQSFEEGRPFQATALALKQAGQQVATIPWALANQYLLDYPRQLLKRKFGVTVPEAESKLARYPEKIAGVVGGLNNPVLKTFGGAKAFLAKPLLKKAGIAGAQAMLYPTEKDFLGLPINPAEKPLQFGLGAAGGLAVPMAGKTLKFAGNQLKKIPGAPEWLASSISDIKDFSKKTIARLGNKVFDKTYSADDYVGQQFTPRFREHLFKQIESLGFGWKNTAQVAKFKQKEIEALSSMGKETRKAFVDAMRKGASADEAAKSILADSGRNMENVIINHNKPVVINNFINGIKRNLLQEKWAVLDKNGNLIPNQVTGIPHDARDNLIRLYNFYKRQPSYYSGLTTAGSTATRLYRSAITAKDWQVMKQSLERLYTGNPQDDRVISNVLRTLINDAKSSGRGIPGYKASAKLWSDAKTLTEIAPKLDQWTDPVKINTLFSGINASNADSKYQLMQQIKSAIPGNLYDDLAAHYTQRNFDPNFYPSLSGFRKLGVTELSKLYYGKYPTGVNPVQQFFNKASQAGQKARQIAAPVTRPVGKAITKATNYLVDNPSLKGMPKVPGLSIEDVSGKFPEKLPKVNPGVAENTYQAIAGANKEPIGYRIIKRAGYNGANSPAKVIGTIKGNKAWRRAMNRKNVLDLKYGSSDAYYIEPIYKDGGGPAGKAPFSKPIINKSESGINNQAPLSDEDVHVLVHFSNQNTPELMIDPKYMGTAHGGQEMRRHGPKTTAHYLAEHVDQYPNYHERHWRFGQSKGKYVSVVPKSQIYDWNADPLGYRNLHSNVAEKRMIHDGYLGYLAGDPPEVRLFKPVKGVKID